MAMSALLTQQYQANFGSPTNFTAAITNTSGATVNVNSIQPMATEKNGARAACCNFGTVAAPPGTSIAQVGGSQFNVAVLAGATVYFQFSASFFGGAVAGATALGNNVYLVSVMCQSSDGSVFQSPSLSVELNQPQFGLSPGSPPNAPVVITSLNFAVPANTAFTLLPL